MSRHLSGQLSSSKGVSASCQCPYSVSSARMCGQGCHGAKGHQLAAEICHPVSLVDRRDFVPWNSHAIEPPVVY